VTDAYRTEGWVGPSAAPNMLAEKSACPCLESNTSPLDNNVVA
jgi:hypothetical protein